MEFKIDDLMASYSLSTADFDRKLQKQIFTLDEMAERLEIEVEQGADANRQSEMQKRIDEVDEKIYNQIRVFLHEKSEADELRKQKDSANAQAKADKEKKALEDNPPPPPPSEDEKVNRLGFFEWN